MSNCWQQGQRFHPPDIWNRIAVIANKGAMVPSEKPIRPAAAAERETALAATPAPQEKLREASSERARKRVRIVLADDHRMFREALGTLLEKIADLEIVAAVGDGQELIRSVRQHEPDIVCMDINMPGMDGIEATRQLRGINPRIKVIALSAFADQHFVLDMLSAGAAGYVTKAGAGDELLRAIRAVQTNRTYLCPDAAASITEACRDGSLRSLVTPRLGSRERQVLQLIADGRTSPEIADRLHLAPSTVEVHRRNIMRKLDLHSVADLTKYAIRNGLTSA
ncbi:MAG: response regulator transcription factor [Candidatus Accumulibacter sp. UW20]|jgi:DNA-binding NarL/FixJ family response regulator